MKAIKAYLSNFNSIEIHPLFDLHLGDAQSDLGNIKRILKHIEETPNAFCILGGDLMDNAITASIGDTYSEKLSPMEQLKKCTEIFSPIKEKIICIVPGNHEARTYKTDGIDITALMAEQLGKGDVYSSTSALLFIRFGENKTRGYRQRKVAYTIYVRHGSGGGSREGSKINKLADMAQIVDADIYITGHTHLPAVFKTGYYRTSMSNSSVQFVNKVFVNAAAHLNYGGYGETAGFKPASKENPVIYLSGTRHKVSVEV